MSTQSNVKLAKMTKILGGWKLAAVLAFAALPLAAEVARTAEIKVSSLGWNSDDSTEFLQAALDSGAATVVVDKVEGPWVTRPLFARSNQTVLFERGVELVAKKGEFREVNDCLFKCGGVTNVLIRGYGATFRMHRADYAAEPYKRGEWRHTLSIGRSRNVTVEGLTLEESGGDGVYLGSLTGNVVLRDLVCDRHHRQGISVISAKGLLIERCVMKNTRGTPPEAGIDFEPNYRSEELTDIVMRDCEIADNEGNGLEFCFLQLDGTSKPLSITVENCRVRGNFRSVAFSSWNKPTFPSGFVRMGNCSFEDARDYALYVIRKPASAFSIEFENCRFSNAQTAAKDAAAVTDIGLFPRFWNDETTDGIRFDNCVVSQPVAREWIPTTLPSLTGGPVKAITGTVRIESPSGERRIALDEAWRKRQFKPVVPGGLPDYRPFDAAKAQRAAVDATGHLPDAMTRLEPVNVRQTAAYRLHASAPGRVRIKGCQCLLGRKVPSKTRMTVSNAEGGEIASFPIFTENEAEISFDVPAAGFYLLSIPVPGNAVRISEANVPIAIEVPEEGVNLIYSAAKLRFRKEKGKRAVLAVRGSAPEKVSATVYTPEGQEVWNHSAVCEWTSFGADADAPAGLWTLEIAPSAAGPFEDCTVLLRGIAPELFLADWR